MSWLGSLLGGGIVQSVEKIALELIETDQESAEAKTVLIKALDPNGKMRRDIMRFITRVYGFYLFNAVVLIYAATFEVGNTEAVKQSLEAITTVFIPITGLFGALATAAFGVNAVNSAKEGK